MEQKLKQKQITISPGKKRSFKVKNSNTDLQWPCQNSYLEQSTLLVLQKQNTLRKLCMQQIGMIQISPFKLSETLCIAWLFGICLGVKRSFVGTREYLTMVVWIFA